MPEAPRASDLPIRLHCIGPIDADEEGHIRRSSCVHGAAAVVPVEGFASVRALTAALAAIGFAPVVLPVETTQGTTALVIDVNCSECAQRTRATSVAARRVSARARAQAAAASINLALSRGGGGSDTN